MRRMRSGLVVSLLSGVLIGASIGLSVGLITLTRTPVSRLPPKVTRVISAAHHGLLEVDYTFLRNSDCNSEAVVWLWHWVITSDGARVPAFVLLTTSPVVFADVSPLLQRMIIIRPLPIGIPSGEWFLKVKYLDSCAPFSWMTGPTARNIPDIPVVIPPEAIQPWPVAETSP